MAKTNLKSGPILWIEEQYEEYDPLFSDLQEIVGQENIFVATTEDEGRTRLQENTYRLVLLDLMLPKNLKERDADLIHLEAGLRLLRELRQNEAWATHHDCLVIVLTARGNPEALIEVKSLLGARGCLLQKPIPVEEIIQFICEMLER